MNRRAVLTVLFLLFFAGLLTAESFRGPVGGTLTVGTTGQTTEIVFGMEEIVLIELGGDPRFLDAVEIELTSPGPVSNVPGAVSVMLIVPASVSGTDGVIDVVGDLILSRPLQRQGKSFYQVLLRTDADPDSSAATVRIAEPVEPSSFPLAVSVISRMKGLAPELYNADFRLTATPVQREIGALQIEYRNDDGTIFEPGPRRPDFTLQINGADVTVDSEYLLLPGLHRVALRSQRFQDQELTVGLEPGRETEIVIPLIPAVATVSYTAPREAVLYLNGELLPDTSGDFTVLPGEHTITMVLEDYTVTRRFVVQEQRTYSLSLSMNIVIEEVN